MKVGIIGGGYVGFIWGTFLSARNHDVVIVDKDELKIDAYTRGNYANYIQERDLDYWYKKAKGNTQYTNDYSLLNTCNVIFICVGTPNDQNGNLDITYVEEALSEINKIKFKSTCDVVIRSTMPVNSSEQLFKQIQNSNIRCGLNPEFLREGEAFNDLNGKNEVVIAEYNSNLENLHKLYQSLYNSEQVKIHLCDLPTAEMIKSVNNSWHALKVTFANEIGRICNLVNSDPKRLMEIFFSDTKLNISTAYMRPGLPFGGSCLVKDTLGLATQFNSEFFAGVLSTNTKHIMEIVNAAVRYETIGIIGLTFKRNTNDVRFSVGVKVAQELMKKGKNVKCFDELIDPVSVGLCAASVDEINNCDLILRLN